MKTIETTLPGVYIIEPQVFGDNRGWFYESYSEKKLSEVLGGIVFVQDNHSFSAQKGTLRGLHFQRNPHAQAKIVRCTRGVILDVAVDIRKGSPNYLKWVSVELSAENHRMLYIPAGFAHGFLTLTDDVEIQYKASDYYAPDCDRSIAWNDPAIGVEWGIVEPVLSAKDKGAAMLKDSDCNFLYSCV
ncbi:MAG: dTDP-4-dehydrorhamnose 3,5-epimerase [Fusobacteriaceae bacterium]|jgi:dTDP-4-dehydrorhamnose reductase/dTDP-4-dehydrorhamnose 3,5-epimerase|nr:dTDP-4-dehydrorhamnose 3,5-epimerase [Fusobacteriaceae bacterium]